MFKKYKKIKALLENQPLLEGLDIYKVIAYDLIKVCYNQYHFSIGTFFKGFFVYNIPSNINTRIMYSIGAYGNRKDYIEIVDYVKNEVQENDNVFLNFDILKKNIYINLKNGKIAYQSIFKLPLGYKSKLYLFLQLWFYLNLYLNLKKKDYQVKKYVAFSSIHPLESVLTLYFKSKGTITYSLQHGLYFVYKDPIPIDAIAYDNLVSDFHLAWGQYTLDEFKKYGIDENLVKEAGYPRKIHEVTQRENKIEIERIIVFLGRKQFEYSNQNALEILKSFVSKYKVALKLHPSLDFDYYSNLSNQYGFELVAKKETISSILTKRGFDLSIAINTTVYYESYMYSIPCVRFKDDTFMLPKGVFDDIFTNIEDLKNLIVYFNTMKPEDFSKKTGIELEYLMGFKNNSYKQIIA